MKTHSQKLTALFLNQILSGIEGYGGKCPNDERCRDLAEALERFIKDSLK